jgi:hypothetical protein
VADHPRHVFWVLVGDPGNFVMERRMLLGIKRRVERAAAAAEPASGTRGS